MSSEAKPWWTFFAVECWVSVTSREKSKLQLGGKVIHFWLSLNAPVLFILCFSHKQSVGKFTGWCSMLWQQVCDGSEKLIYKLTKTASFSYLSPDRLLFLPLSLYIHGVMELQITKFSLRFKPFSTREDKSSPQFSAHGLNLLLFMWLDSTSKYRFMLFSCVTAPILFSFHHFCTCSSSSWRHFYLGIVYFLLRLIVYRICFFHLNVLIALCPEIQRKKMNVHINF